MAGQHHNRIPLWTIAFPLIATAALAAKFAHVIDAASPLVAGALLIVLCGTVFAAVHHAEIVAARIGEPYGAILLALAVTVIEAGLIIALMLAAPDGGPAIARDTIYSAVMLVLTAVLGVCLLAGGRRHFEQTLQVQGTAGYLAVLGALATIALILPNYTVTTVGPYYNRAQLTAVALVSLGLYAAFLYVQTVRHREDFLPVGHSGETSGEKPGNAVTAASLVLLLVALTGVVLLAKALSPQLTALIAAAHLPYDFAGVVVAGLVLLPEAITALRAARANQLQTSINLALGSAIASIALTIPVVTAFAAFFDQSLQLGVSPAKTVLLALAIFTSVTTLGTGRTTILQGAVHLGIFVIFMVLAAVP
jgi:Ca2+:H+ antiporter